MKSLNWGDLLLCIKVLREVGSEIKELGVAHLAAKYFRFGCARFEKHIDERRGNNDAKCRLVAGYRVQQFLKVHMISWSRQCEYQCCNTIKNRICVSYCQGLGSKRAVSS